MFLSIADISIMGVGAVVLTLWLAFFFKGNKYASLFQPLEEKEFPLKEIYGVGYAVMEAIGYKYKSAADRKLRQEVEILYGEKYADYYIRVTYAQKITISFLMVVLGFIFYGFTGDWMIMLIIFIFAFLAYYYFGTATKKRISARSDEMLRDFADVVSEIALLTNAGMILRETWEQVAYSRDTTIYKEMQLAVEQMKNGMAEVDAFHAFGNRCIIPEVRKFSSTLMQGLSKGNAELTAMLQQQSKEVWEAKKQNVRRQGEKAASKLLIPICIMFVGILVMLLVPIFTNLGG